MVAKKFVYINDTFVEEAQASILVSDLSIHRGYGIFDFFKTINGKPIFLQDHLERFYHSAASMHLKVIQTPIELENILTEMRERNQIPDSGIKITLTGGYSSDGYTLPESPNLIITQNPLHLSLDFNPAGISVVTYPYQRQLSEMKTLDYSMAIWLQPYIKESNSDDVLYHNNGSVKEVPRANFFIVTKDDEVVTAKTNVLSGVIRKNIFKLENTGLKITERDFTLDELRNAKEAFITSTTKHISPVLKVDGKSVGDGKAGKTSAHLSSQLLERVRQEL
ncbi:aminotransferase class IV [Pedobacter sp. L105]|uniref:aminotransferase class IV n=1 Tax=Pedobacter sp. L105 TaxID=1641871 RepID=UPI00131C7C71|nr:aminotransferase class IV [Pedobacter sp. L105]